MKKKLLIVLSLILIISMAATACGGQDGSETSGEDSVAEPIIMKISRLQKS